MTDQWVPGPGCTPVPPDGIPPANTWTPADSCAPPAGPSITGGVIITGVPATIGSMVNGQYAWTITLNDGQSPPNFSIDRYSGGALVDHPIFISGVDGSVAFTGSVTLAEDPTEPMQAATKEYVDLHSAGVTEAPVDGQLYGRQSEGWTVVPPPPVLEAPTDGQAYVRQSQAWAPLSASMAGYLPTAGGVMTGGIQMNGSPANRWIVGLTSGSLRWAVSYGDATAESGSNAGSNFTIQSFTDAGAPLATPLTINRQFGNIVIPGLSGIAPLAINGPSGSWRAIQSQTNGVTRWNMFLGDPSGELGSNLGSNFTINRYSDAGANLGAALSINRQTGQATFSALPSFPGGVAGNVLSTDGAGALSWIAPGGGGISDAPNDGTAYARKSAGWSNLAHTDITDWTATLAPYALTTSVPVAATTLPLASGVAAVGISTAYARADHVHPTTAIGENRIINGNFAVNQRAYISGTALAAAAYGHDRWKAGASGCTYTFAAALPDTTVTITAGTLTQVIEAGMIEGGVYTLSWTGTAQVRVYQGTPTGVYAASPLTTASLTAGTNTIVEFNAGTLVRAKLELGSVATSFNRQSLTKSLADCQRYYQVYPQIIAGGYNAAGATVYNTHFLSTVMRAAPTGTLSNLTSNNNISVLNFQFANANLARLSAVIGTAGYGYISVDLALSAEL